VQQLFLLAENGHVVSRDCTTLSEWPWTWFRVLTYIKQVRSVMERAAMDENPEEAWPPRWMWFRDKELDEWFESRRKG